MSKLRYDLQVCNHTVIILNLKEAQIKDITPITVKVGRHIITQEQSAKLLGILFNEKQDWKNQIKEVVTALNRRLYTTKRLKTHISKNALLKIEDGLYRDPRHPLCEQLTCFRSFLYSSIFNITLTFTTSILWGSLRFTYFYHLYTEQNSLSFFPTQKPHGSLNVLQYVKNESM